MSSSVNVSIGVPSPGLNFDELSSLAIADPAKFEELRLALIKQVINSPGSNADQLAALQQRLDCGANVLAPAYLSCLVLSDWLGESYQKLTQQLTAVQSQAQHQ